MGRAIPEHHPPVPRKGIVLHLRGFALVLFLSVHPQALDEDLALYLKKTFANLSEGQTSAGRKGVCIDPA